MDLSFYNKLIDAIALAKSEGKRPAFAYDRVSDQANAGGISLEYQESQAERYAGQSGLYVVHYFTVIESARSEGRKVFNKMIDLALKFDVRDLIFKNTDRMSRNYRDLMRIEDLYEKHYFTIHFYQTFRTLTRKSTYADKFIMNVEIAAARQLSDKLSHDITENHKHKANRGVGVHAPIGYIFSKTEKRYIKDPATEGFVQMLLDEFDRGNYSLTEYAHYLNQRGYPSPKGMKWTKGALYYLLTNPFFHGEFCFKDSILPGNQDTYYDKQRWADRMERLRTGSSYSTSRKGMITMNYLFSRFIKCGKCGKTLTGDTKKGKFVYYMHRCGNAKTGTYIPEETISRLIHEQASMVQFDESFGDILKTLFADVCNQNDKNQQPAIAGITRKIHELEVEQNRLVSLYGRGTLPLEVLERNINQLQDQIKSLCTEQKRLHVNKSQFILNTASVIDDLLKFNAIYNQSSPEDRAALLRTKAEYVVLDDGKVRFEWQKPYAFVLDPEILEHKDAVRTRSTMHARLNDVRTLKAAVKRASEDWMLWMVA